LPEILAVVVSFLLLNVWYLASLAVNEKLIPKSYELIINGFILFAATFFGAYVAFKLNENKEINKLESRQKVALDMSIFILIRMIQGFRSTLKSIEDYKSVEQRAFSMPAFKPPDYQDLNFDFNELSFLLQYDSQIVLDLAIEQDRYKQLFNSINERNKFYLERVEPQLSKNNIRNMKVNEQQLRSVLGDSVFDGAFSAVNSMDMHIDGCSHSLSDLYNRTAHLARKIYPQTPFMRIEDENLFK